MSPSARPHAPIRPPREGHIGELVFAARWDALMNGPRSDETSPLGAVLEVLSPTIRRARVAASLICLLGTNLGQCLMHEAKHLRERGVRYPFLVAWTINNVRSFGINDGLRSEEWLLAPEDHYGCGMWGYTTLVRRPAVSGEDHETLERVCIWLGTDDGLGFIHACEGEIRSLQSERGRRERSLQAKSASIGSEP